MDLAHSKQVCHLRKAIYTVLGKLLEGSRACYARFSNFLPSQGIRMCQMGHSVLVPHDAKSITVLLYVDDKLVTGNDTVTINRLLLALNDQFDTRHLGELRHFFGIEFIRNFTSIILSQAAYAQKMLQKASMQSCEQCDTPMAEKSPICLDDQPYSDPTFYGRLVCVLQNLTIIHPDLAFSVNNVCQYMHMPF